MSEVFSVVDGEAPLLVSIPHDGRLLAPGQAERMTDVGLALPDTDWHVRRLYEFVGNLGASVIAANYSRYVVDLNRPADDGALYPEQLSTGICPQMTFAGEPLYTDGDTIADDERQDRIETYWQPYHNRIRELLDAIREQHGYALLWDAHSIASEVPALFEGELPALNVGTNNGSSCDTRLTDAVMANAGASGYSAVLDGRFRGGHITRHYGDPDNRIHAIQLELAQRTYMDETSREYDPAVAGCLAETLRDMLTAYMTAARNLAGR